MKTKFVEGNQSHPRHKIVRQAETLEESLAILESVATEYIIKKLKPSFVPLSNIADPKTNKKKTITEIKYTMARNNSDNNIIEIFENTCITEVTPAMVFGVNEKTTRNTRLIGYFCYIKCDGLLQTSAKNVAKRSTSTQYPTQNPKLIQQMTKNDLFQKCQRSVAMNTIDADLCDINAEISEEAWVD